MYFWNKQWYPFLNPGYSCSNEAEPCIWLSDIGLFKTVRWLHGCCKDMKLVGATEEEASDAAVVVVGEGSVSGTVQELVGYVEGSFHCNLFGTAVLLILTFA